MRFENPVALGLLALLLLLLLTRRRTTRRQIPVGNLFLWREAVTTRPATFAWRLRRHVLLLLQAACLAAIALALAAPMIAGRSPVALILDTSLSMGAGTDGTTRLDMARREAEALLDSLPSGTPVHIVTAGGRPRIVGAFRAGDNVVTDVLAGLGVTDADSDLSGAIELARRADPPPRLTYVITDGSSVGAGAIQSGVEWKLVGQAADNAAITALSARASPSSRERLEIVVGVHNYGAEATARVALDHDGRRIGERAVQLAAGGYATLLFVTSNAGGVLTARLQHLDALPADNVRRLVTPGAAPIRVAPSALRSAFLERALRVHPDLELTEPGAREVSFTVCEGCAELPPGAEDVLLLPPQGGAPPRAVRLTLADRDHPIANGLELDGTTAQLLVTGEAPDDASVIVEAGGIPVVLTYRVDGRRVVEVRVDPDGGTWPVSTGFPVLISNIAHWLAGHDAGLEAATAGDPLRWPLHASQRGARMVGPDGATVGASINDGILTVAETANAGVYRVQSDAGERLIAVNPAVEDSDLARNVTPPGAPTAGPRQDGAALVPISSVLIVVALAALAAEWRVRLAGAKVL